MKYLMFALIISSICFVALTPLIVSAAPFRLEGLIPCGRSEDDPNTKFNNETAFCTVCHFWQLGDNIVRFSLFILAIPLATLGFLVGGIYMLTAGGSSGRIEAGKKIMKSSLIGLLIAFSGWLIVDTIIKTFASGSLTTAWNKFPICPLPEKPPEVDLSSIQLTAFSGYIDYGAVRDGYDTQSEGYQEYLRQYGDTTAIRDNADIAPRTPEQIAQIESNLAAYDEQIRAVAEANDISPEHIKAIIIAESSGNQAATHQDLDGETSYGLMQIRPDTAKALDPSLKNLSDAEIIGKLQDPKYNIQLGTTYYKQLLNKYGGEEDLASAAYNGGPAANNPSRDCEGKLRWQCEWDNKQHTTPNEGYKPTRKYINNIRSIECSLKGDCP